MVLGRGVSVYGVWARQELKEHFSILYLIRDYVHYILIWDFLYNIYSKEIAKRYSSYMPHLGHDAIVIVHSDVAGMSMYGSGIGLLINHFRKTSPITPYAVYHCTTIEQFRDVVRKPLAESLWIFGHGYRGGVGLYSWKREICNYSEFKNMPQLRKKYIYQFHCNHGDEESLTETLSSGRGFVSNQINNPTRNRKFIKQILEEFNIN